MCGINGIVYFKEKVNGEKLNSIVHEMNQKIIYRGPDHEGIYYQDGLSIGMRRLAILDLEGGEQPIYNEDKTIVVVFNGEIYNFLTLRKELKQLGHRFYTKTDTEVIVHGYEEYGTDIFNKLDGMFAIALYDKKSEKVLLARDRMGEKPCYYYYDQEKFLFASELKSLIETGFIAKEIDSTALCQFLQLTYVPAPLSIFKKVFKIEPAHYLEISLKEKSVKKNSYWKLEKNTDLFKEMSYEDAVKYLRKLIKQSVKQRMISDVPVGAFLSGGIDSSSIVALMSRLSKEPINTFTIGFEEEEYDERDRAREVVKAYQTKHYERILDFKEAIPIINEIISCLDEPFADSSVLPTYFVSKMASEKVKVVLTGDAGDELFLGYNKYLMDYYAQKYAKVPKIIRKRMIEPAIKKVKDNRGIIRKIKKVINNMEKTPFERRRALMSLGLKEDEILQLVKQEYYDKNSFSQIEKDYFSKKDYTDIEKTQWIDLRYVLEGDMLTKVDRMSMLNSLETRTPLLSKDIIEFAISIPTEYKLKGKNLKRIWKDAMSPLLPKDFEKYPKSGFGVPLDYWFRNELKEELQKVFDKEKIERQGIFNYSGIAKILEEHFSEKENRKSEIWALYVFQKWYENYIG